MAKPRVFVSSTYYDLKHIRSSLELFIESLGFEAVLSEKGDIPYTPDIALDESCYREAAAADIFVLVIGGRYGSEVSSSDVKIRKAEIEAYDSITRREFETAHENNIPVFVLIENSVHAEYRTYLRNKESSDIKYAHVDSVNVFRFIEFVSSRQRNNPIFSFERSSQIEQWLRDQWSGLFRELLRNRNQQRQFVALSGQVNELKEVNDTLKAYLEVVLKEVTPGTSDQVIEIQERRLEELKRTDMLRSNSWYEYLKTRTGLNDAIIEKMIREPNTEEEFVKILSEYLSPSQSFEITDIAQTLNISAAARSDFSEARDLLGLHPIPFSNSIEDLAARKGKAEPITRRQKAPG
jgi:hypothetical protein